ncbi:MAG TPA: PQQ-binding-like beta-propeller repeat protein [Gemmataceae bacterium]|nr:PQQ-binding-like beta-propeller repeat protein [Gemmataceae bacterium]
MKHVSLAIAVLTLAALGGLLLTPAGSVGQPQQGLGAAPQARVAPAHVADAVPFQTKDGKVKGWKLVIPGNRPLATPAVVGGKVFIGGGFGSHEFYAFDATTGKKVWQYQTADDGPTAAVVEGDAIAFNTESCELEIITAAGKPVWKKWLGDPLMSMPAIADGKVFMAYPDSKHGGQHYLAAFGLKTGNELWKAKIAGEIITAPVIDNQRVYLATLEGTVYCFKQDDGSLVWQEKKNATSSPLVYDGRCYYSRRDEVTVKKGGKDVKQQNEQLAGRGTGKDGKSNGYVATTRPADYLDYSKRAASAGEKALQGQDAAVGFGGLGGLGGGVGAPNKGASKIQQAQMNLGQASVAGVWSYQGSRPFAYQGRLYSGMGDTLECVDPKTEKVLWKQTLRKGKGPVLDSSLTPPALVNGKVFVGTARGAVQCRSAKTGELLWSADVGEPVVFQPAVARGRVYVSTSTGHLYCLETGDPKDDGWLMWGGSAAHNGLR